MHLSSRWNWKRQHGSRRTCFGVWVPRTSNYPSIKLNPREHAPYDHNARPSQTDTCHGNSATIRSNEHTARFFTDFRFIFQNFSEIVSQPHPERTHPAPHTETSFIVSFCILLLSLSVPVCSTVLGRVNKQTVYQVDSL